MNALANPAAVGNHDRPSRRRTKRMALIVTVEVSGKDLARSSFSAVTTATNLNRNGAMLHLNRDLSLDSVLVIKNSRGVRTSVRVVSQTSVADVYAYGLEFLESENAKDFWGINFPSSQPRR
jgi:hypothetical protein